jgi:acyl-coenzyme A synthetase/AMP-(fatty) acid ligase
MPRPEKAALHDYIRGETARRTISDAECVVTLDDALNRSCLGGETDELAGRSVLIATSGQLASALTMVELDGIARRMLLCPPDLDRGHVTDLIDVVGIDAVVTDQPRWYDAGRCLVVRVSPSDTLAVHRGTERVTEWLLTTSGTSGTPKVVEHTLEGLAGAILAEAPAHPAKSVWATFYDIRRYGGLQIFLRAMIGGGSLVLSEPKESSAEHVARLNAGGVTHISGTPSHWRKLLMSPAAAGFSPRYVRLSGEIADQAVLDALARAFPDASIGHAYASTEAGVGFSVDDGREGFPAEYVGKNPDGVEMKVVDGTLRVRSPRTARAYVGASELAIADKDGFVNTGDIVELRDGRYHFVGRLGGIINVGGLKVHPEEVETIINRHRSVRVSRARLRRNSVIGAVVVADVVLADAAEVQNSALVRSEILAMCRRVLAPYKVPASISFVDRLEVTAAGKLARADASHVRVSRN